MSDRDYADMAARERDRRRQLAEQCKDAPHAEMYRDVAGYWAIETILAVRERRRRRRRRRRQPKPKRSESK